MTNLLTNHRREFLAKNIVDVLKLAMGAGLVSDFFIKYPLPLRIILWFIIVLGFLGTWVLYPAQEKRNK